MTPADLTLPRRATRPTDDDIIATLALHYRVHEPAWIGTPLDEDWPGDHTHWTPHPAAPKEPTA